MAQHASPFDLPAGNAYPWTPVQTHRQSTNLTVPKPLGLAFAEALLGKVPLPMGLFCHLVYVTAVTTLFLTYIDERPGFLKALGFGLLLWVLVLLLFFPFVGWGALGLGIGPQLMVASLVPHVLYALLLWLLPRWAF